MLFSFTVHWCFDEQPEISSGIICASSFGDAAEKIEKDYFDNVDSIEIKYLSESDYICLNDDHSIGEIKDAFVID